MSKRRRFDPQVKREAVELSCSPNVTRTRVLGLLGRGFGLVERCLQTSSAMHEPTCEMLSPFTAAFSLHVNSVGSVPSTENRTLVSRLHELKNAL